MPPLRTVHAKHMLPRPSWRELSPRRKVIIVVVAAALLVVRIAPGMFDKHGTFAPVPGVVALLLLVAAFIALRRTFTEDVRQRELRHRRKSAPAQLGADASHWTGRRSFATPKSSPRSARTASWCSMRVDPSRSCCPSSRRTGS